jgi:hypothetical protein
MADNPVGLVGRCDRMADFRRTLSELLEFAV